VTKKILGGVIVLTVGTFSAGSIVTQAYLIAALAFTCGLVWLLLEITDKSALVAFFFSVFLALAVVETLNNAPFPLMLAGLSADLAAWDLCRFRARLMDGAEGEIEPSLEASHLQKLAAGIGSGFVIAVLFSSVRLSISFVALAALTLLAALGLRWAVLSVRSVER
jgi:hypothetical protein